MKIEIRNLNFYYGKKKVLFDINASISPGITGLLGPNTSGKSTLLKCISGILKFQGDIFIGDKNIKEFSFDKLVSKVAYMPQDTSNSAVLTVFEAILLGRLHFLSFKESEEDIKKVCKVMDLLGISDIASRFLNELSGGQKQLISVSQVLVRDPDFILMDEPTNNLDLKHQLELFELIRGIAKKNNINVLIALHDLNIAAKYCDDIILVHDGRVHSQGKPLDILTVENIRDIYGVNVELYKNNETMSIIPLNSLKMCLV